MPQEFTKDPCDVLSYMWNWNGAAADGGPWLATGETITGTPTITLPTGGTLVMDSQSNTTTTVTVKLSAGTDGVDYAVACKIVTSAGHTKEKTITIMVRQQ
jgi:hypothetical protein